MGLYMNNDRIGYQVTSTGFTESERGNPDAYVSLVMMECPEYMLEHEMRCSPGRSLSGLVEGELTP